MSLKSQSRYKALIEKVFFDRYKQGDQFIEFLRDDLVQAAKKLKIPLPKNLGDVIYSIRYRTPMPDSIMAIQPADMEWIIEGAGRSKYKFSLVQINRILPNRNLVAIKIPDATLEIVNAYALSDEQALLAKVRYNRLIDIFLGVASYSLQNHLRTTVKSIGQVEIDEMSTKAVVNSFCPFRQKAEATNCPSFRRNKIWLVVRRNTRTSFADRYPPNLWKTTLSHYSNCRSKTRL